MLILKKNIITPIYFTALLATAPLSQANASASAAAAGAESIEPVQSRHQGVGKQEESVVHGVTLKRAAETVESIPSLYSIIGVGPVHLSLDEIITMLGNMRTPFEEMITLNPNWIMLGVIEDLEKLRGAREKEKLKALPELMEKGLFAIHFYHRYVNY